MSDVFDEIEIISLDDVDSGYGRSISNNDDNLEAEIDDLEVEPWDPTIYEEAFAVVDSWMEEEKIEND
ncbi:hypothetical protein L3Y34_019358 [Caenorhabditis briggsae]|uniref:Uncharacterized protein n=1 Tax=Caenorhabditis briggsae TaxID=6238 RepID=A0AAE9DNT7_CAEBR|nr:hypothetical protein L3Y34_019358 [Caenorhabditis briggsae]